MFEQDYLMRMINDCARAVLTLMGKKVRSPYQPDMPWENIFLADKLPLREQLQHMIGKFEINEAENLLFDTLKPGDKEDMMLAVWFYTALNQLPDSTLAAGNYTREEIAEGLTDAAKQFGIDPILLGQFTPSY